MSNTTSYAEPASQSTASCWVAGIAKPSGPTTGCVEAVQVGGRGRPELVAPQLGPHPDDEVDAADRRAWFAQRRQAGDEIDGRDAGAEIQLEVGVRRGAEREDPGLRCLDVARHGGRR